MATKKKKVWLVSVDMGYGHQRAAYPLKDIAYGRIITANSDKNISRAEQATWQRLKTLYENVSRMRTLPVIGGLLWKAYDSFQSISPYYPFRDLSKPNLGALSLHKLIKKGFMQGIVDYTKKLRMPYVATFYAPALAAAYAHVKEVYCVVTDTDINRAWVPVDPDKNKLYYLTPSRESTKRLMAYGVPEERIFFTGFPLPKENLGSNLEILKRDVGNRLPNLDPNRVFLNRYHDTLKKHLGGHLRPHSNHPLTITYAVGGAGAQKEIGYLIMKSLRDKILGHKIKVNLIAGTRLDVELYFEELVRKLNLQKELGHHLFILFTLDKKHHFKAFNEILHTTDILWTKPSELVFYTGLGLPIIMSPPLGAHEVMNQKWLMRMGSGLQQENPVYTSEWLFDWLERGILAEAAWEGFTEAPRYGTYNIEKVVFSKEKRRVKFRY